MAGDDLDLPEDLAKMVEEDEEEEEINDSFFGKIQNMDMDELKTKAQTTMLEVKQAAEEKCTVMWTLTQTSKEIQGNYHMCLYALTET